MAADQSLRECTKYSSPAVDAVTVISTRPAKVCAMECTSTRTGGKAALWDSTDSVLTDNTDDIVAETAASVSGNTASTGKIERYTNYGLVVDASGCAVTLSWVD